MNIILGESAVVLEGTDVMPFICSPLRAGGWLHGIKAPFEHDVCRCRRTSSDTWRF